MKLTKTQDLGPWIFFTSPIRISEVPTCIPATGTNPDGPMLRPAVLQLLDELKLERVMKNEDEGRVDCRIFGKHVGRE